MESPVLPPRSIVGIAEQLTPRLRTRSDQNPNDIYVGSVLLPGHQQRARAYVKVFPAADRGQLVYNEVIGHYLAQQCGLPSPFTFPCACRTSLLRKSMQLPIGSDQRTQFVLGVASVDGGYSEVKQTASGFGARWADVMNWHQVGLVAVFDELMGNDDRHIENLIRRGPHDYVLIDSERILFGERWFDFDLSSLRTRRCDANILADAIADGTDELMRRRMIEIAQRIMRVTLLSVPEISESMEQLCKAPRYTTARLIEMLNSRRNILPSLMQWHLEKGDLFHASSRR